MNYFRRALGSKKSKWRVLQLACLYVVSHDYVIELQRPRKYFRLTSRPASNVKATHLYWSPCMTSPMRTKKQNAWWECKETMPLPPKIGSEQWNLYQSAAAVIGAHHTIAAKIHSNLEAALCKLYRFEEASKAAERATALDPTWAKAWWGRGICAESQKRSVHAVQYC